MLDCGLLEVRGVARSCPLPSAGLGAGHRVSAQGKLVALGWSSPTLCLVSKDQSWGPLDQGLSWVCSQQWSDLLRP